MGRGPQRAYAAVRWLTSALFTLEEAEELLDGSIRELAEQDGRDRAEMEPLRTRWQRIVIAIGSNGGGLEKRDAEQLRDEAGAADRRARCDDRARSPATACRSRTSTRGLVDFPAVIDGEPALLCWRVGEERIGFWHARRTRASPARRPL